MWKVMIVEDEWIVREGLRHTIAWEEADCQVVGEAANGADALKQLAALQPDIILSDIRMPGMSGIEMARQAKELCPDAEMIFLTGFDDFAYVQQALRLGACDYMLKPVDPDELMKVIHRAVERLREQRKARSEREELRRQLKESQPITIEPLARFMLLGQADEAQVEQWARHTDHCSPKAIVIAAAWEEEGTRLTLCEWFRDQGAPQAGASSAAEQPWWVTVPLTEHSLAAIGFTESGDEWTAPLQSFIEQHQLLDLRIGISGPHDRISGLRSAYHEALSALEYAQASKRVWQYDAKANIRFCDDWSLADVLKDIHQRFDEDISLQEMAARLHMSESNFSKLFKKYAGSSFSEYVTGIRMKKAKELLRKPDAKVYEVALRSGYQDQRYFSQIFRRWTGLTPTEYRQRLGLSAAEGDAG